MISVVSPLCYVCLIAVPEEQHKNMKMQMSIIASILYRYYERKDPLMSLS